MLDRQIDSILRHSRRSLIIAVVLTVVIGSLLWWEYIWQSPQSAFNGMLANNLTAASVTKYINASSSTQSVNQYARLEMGNTNAADWLVTATQSGSSVTTESIGTPTTGYIRYTNILTNLKPESVKKLDFNKVLNVWAKSDNKTDTALKQLFSQTLLDISSAPIPPIGDFPPAQQQNLVSYMQNQNIFAPSYKNVKSQVVNGENVFTYTVAVHLGPYIRLMQAYAHDLGMTSLDSLDPSQYSTVPPVSVLMSVNKTSHHLVSITYPSTGFIQSYSNWGLLTSISLPHKTISTTELQSRLQSLE
ncbi:MAG: hypothetical protein ACREF5_01065 [Candidatus Saccharimonadales bacterium]